MKDFSVAIANDLEFRLVRDALMDKGIPVWSGTQRATGMEDYHYLSWTGSEVCRANTIAPKHFKSALEFMAHLACPNIEKRRQLQEELKQAEVRVQELKDALEALA